MGSRGQAQSGTEFTVAVGATAGPTAERGTEEMSRSLGPDLARGRGEDQQAGCCREPRLLGEAPLFSSRPGPEPRAQSAEAARRGTRAGRARRALDAGQTPTRIPRPGYARPAWHPRAPPAEAPPLPGPQSGVIRDGRLGCHLGLTAPSPRARAATSAARPPERWTRPDLPSAGPADSLGQDGASYPVREAGSLPATEGTPAALHGPRRLLQADP